MPTNVQEKLVGGFVRFLETGDDDAGVLATDVFADLNVPHWRYQIQGIDAVSDMIRSGSPGGASITLGRCAATATGFVIEAQEQQDDHIGPGTVYRTLWLVDTDGDRITELVVYCTGEWDQDTQARHAAEAPMIRP